LIAPVATPVAIRVNLKPAALCAAGFLRVRASRVMRIREPHPATAAPGNRRPTPRDAIAQRTTEPQP